MTLATMIANLRNGRKVDVWVWYRQTCQKCGTVWHKIDQSTRQKLELRDVDDGDEGDFTGHPSSCCFAGTDRSWRVLEVPRGCFLTIAEREYYGKA